MVQKTNVIPEHVQRYRESGEWKKADAAYAEIRQRAVQAARNGEKVDSKLLRDKADAAVARREVERKLNHEGKDSLQQNYVRSLPDKESQKAAAERLKVRNV